MSQWIYVLLIVLIIYVLKPSFVFKPNGKVREYGFGMDSEGYKKTVLTIHVILFGVISVLYVYSNATAGPKGLGPGGGLRVI